MDSTPSGQPAPKKPNSATNWTILVVILVVVVAGAIYAVTRNEPTSNANENSNTNGFVNQNVNVTNVNSSANVNTQGNSNTNVALITNTNKSGWKKYENKELGFSVEYPANWYVGTRPATDTSDPLAYLASKKEYIDFYINGDTGIQLSKEGSYVELFVDKGLGSDPDPKVALKNEQGRDALPLITEKFITINNIQAYRALRQVKQGDKMPSGQTWDITRTDVEYSFLHNKNLYRVWLEIDGNDPTQTISTFDSIAHTFQLI